MKIIVIDNYDSFTYNLVHYLEDLDLEKFQQKFLKDSLVKLFMEKLLIKF